MSLLGRPSQGLAPWLRPRASQHCLRGEDKGSCVPALPAPHYTVFLWCLSHTGGKEHSCAGKLLGLPQCNPGREHGLGKGFSLPSMVSVPTGWTTQHRSKLGKTHFCTLTQSKIRLHSSPPLWGHSRASHHSCDVPPCPSLDAPSHLTSTHLHLGQEHIQLHCC